jgi:predicted permease
MRRALGTLTGRRADDDLERELAAHLEMVEEDLRRRGHTPADAVRLARLRVGAPAQAMDRLRDQRGLPDLSSVWLDLKLGVRMLRRSWGLSLVAGIAMTAVILIAAGSFTILRVLSGVVVPLDEGDRVVALQTFDRSANRVRPTAWVDFDRWRGALGSIDDIGAFRSVPRVLAPADGPAGTVPVVSSAEPLQVAEMTASGFTVARVGPLLGRPLVADDEHAGAGPVVVIGYDLWRSRFMGDPAVVGRRVRLDGAVHTVVGVMPAGFQFPVNHNLWVPLGAGTAPGASRQRAAFFVFGRLARGITPETANATLAAVGIAPPAGESPDQFEARVVPYTRGFVHLEPLWADLLLILVTVLLVPPCANVAILMYARTVTRQREFAARHALGASRARIIGQLFVEALVLAGAAAGLALLLYGFTFAGATVDVSQSPGATPFWMDFSLSSAMMLYVGAFVLGAAAIVGAVPALRATGPLVQAGLRTMQGGGSPQLGPTWTILIVAQVAVAVAVLPPASELAWGLLRPGVLGPGFPAERFATVRLDIDRVAQARLVRELEEAPDLSGVTVAAAQLGGDGADRALVDVDSVGDARSGASDADVVTGLEVELQRIAPGFFDVLDTPLRAGRAFTPDDPPADRAVIVNQTFAHDVLGTVSPLGRRIRYRRLGSGTIRAGEPWREIVGVVDDRPANRSTRVIYEPVALEELSPSYLLLRTATAPGVVEQRVRALATALDPWARVDRVRRLDEVYIAQERRRAAGALALASATIVILLLSTAGLYSLMAFTVTQRRREIGIRSALGAQPRRLLAAIFTRALGQVSVGVGVGSVAALALTRWLPIQDLGGWPVPWVLPAAVVLLMLLGLVAAIGPARRGLRVAPTEALRVE